MTETPCRHYWDPTDDGAWACTECSETCPACSECGRWTGTSLLICDRCVRRVRRMLDDIETALALYCPNPPTILPGIRYDRDRITGSAGDSDDPLRWTWNDAWRAVGEWADMWAEASGMPRAVKIMDYLRGHVLWAAHNREASDWDQWLVEMRQALAVAKREAGLLPKRMPAPCAHCGGMAVQTWANQRLVPHADGLSEEVVCTGCGLTWRSAEHYRQVSKQHLQALPDVQPDTLVTLTEACAVWPDIPLKTWRTWRDRGDLPEHVSWDVRGVAQYRVGDLAVLAERRLGRTRRARKAG